MKYWTSSSYYLAQLPFDPKTGHTIFAIYKRLRTIKGIKGTEYKKQKTGAGNKEKIFCLFFIPVAYSFYCAQPLKTTLVITIIYIV